METMTSYLTNEERDILDKAIDIMAFKGQSMSVDGCMSVHMINLERKYCNTPLTLSFFNIPRQIKTKEEEAENV